VTSEEWNTRREAALEAEAALETYKRALPDRPPRGTASKLGKEARAAELARWARENAECDRLRGIYRAAVRHWLDPEPVEVHQPRPQRIMRAA